MSSNPTPEQVAIDDINEAIAQFDGWQILESCPVQFEKNGRRVTHADLKYHSSWDWLMPVVEKIEGMNWCVRVENWPKCFPTPYKELYSVWMWLNPEDAPEIQTYSDVKIKAVHVAIYQFIQWYNKTKGGQQ